MKFLLDTHIFIAWSRGTLGEEYPKELQLVTVDRLLTDHPLTAKV